ncbi:MAG: BamA/TamA family outer membrane protein [Vicinamibacteria bacterium]
MARTRRGLAVVLASLALLVLPAPRTEAASFPPGFRFQTIRHGRVSVHFHQGLEATARVTASLAEQILAEYARRYAGRPRHLHVVLADEDDEPNGFASPFPYPLVQIRVAAPDGTSEMGAHEGWLRLVLTHELAHVVHLEEAHGLPAFGRKLFGRAPFLFPNTLSPTWLIEGLATREETRLTAFGRGRSSDTRMLLRAAALEGRFPRQDEAMLGLDAWPAGLAPYLVGEEYLRGLEQAHGDDTLPGLSRVHSGRLVPWLDERTAHMVTGRSHHESWASFEDAEKARAEELAARVRARGETASAALTGRGVRQTAPRFSPDGSLVAYTSSALERRRELRVVRADGGGDRALAERNGGSVVAWTRDGAALVFDEPEAFRRFEQRSDLRLVELASGRVRRLTHGLRASEPDAGPDNSVVFVRRHPDRSELATIGLDGTGLRELTRSPPGTYWSGPRFSPRGERVAAARLGPDGALDVVVLDLSTLGLLALTADRARDMEPAWTPDGESLLFRSDRDGISNLYRVPAAGGPLERVSDVLGGAFAPDVSPDGRSVAFAAYAARGYDVRLMPLVARGPAEAYLDEYAQGLPAPELAAGAATAYRPLPAALPRFWTPLVFVDDEETRLGAATAGADPLLRHAYVLDLRYGLESERLSTRASYRYDRFAPTFQLDLKDDFELAPSGVFRAREAALSLAYPLALGRRSAQSVALGWRRGRESSLAGARPSLDLGGAFASWSLDTARRWPFSISPIDGARLRLGVLLEDPALGSELSLTKLTGDARGYLRLSGRGDVLALRAAGGATLGEPGFRRSYSLGGFGGSSLDEVALANRGVLRGFPDDTFRGRQFANASAELRLPLLHPQRGYRSAPVFLRHLHAAVFVDAGSAWSESFEWGEVRTGFGVALGLDANVSHALPLTVTLGVAQGSGPSGDTRVYFRAGLSY